MKTINLAISLIFMVSCGGQQINNTQFDEKASDNILIGHVNLDGLKTAPFNEWFDTEFEDYEADMLVLDSLDKDDFIDNLKITMVLATWCGDSRREVPRFYKILEVLGYDLDNMEVICVDTKKVAEGTNVDQLDIQKVPTMIFFKQGVEIGRIIESPQESLEKDMVKIMGTKL